MDYLACDSVAKEAFQEAKYGDQLSILGEENDLTREKPMQMVFKIIAKGTSKKIFNKK